MRNSKNNRFFWLERGLRFLVFGLLLGALAGFVVMFLWNALLPDILGVSIITFWQALGLLLLSRILFGRYGGPGYGGRGVGRSPGSRREWKKKMAGRWQQLTPEQREQMKQNWRNRCRPRGDEGEGAGERVP